MGTRGHRTEGPRREAKREEEEREEEEGREGRRAACGLRPPHKERKATATRARRATPHSQLQAKHYDILLRTDGGSTGGSIYSSGIGP